MYSDYGNRLHVLASIIFWLYMITGIIIGILYAFLWDDVVEALFIAPIVGFVSGYLNSLVLHVVADIAENLDYLNKNVYTITDIIDKTVNKDKN